MGFGTQTTTFAHIPNNTKPQWWNDPGLRRNIIHCAGICLCPFYLGYDQSLLAGLQALPMWQSYFGRPTGSTLGLIAACIFLPALVAGFVGGWLCDRFGRKKIIWSGSATIIAGAIFQGLCRDKGQFMGSRVIIGWGGAITKVAAPTLLQEIAHPRLRGTMGTMYYTFYYVGSMTAALMAIAGYYIDSSWSWRLPCIIQVVGPIITTLLTLSAPESPRWLAKNNRMEEAKAVLVKHHANGAENDPMVEWEFGEIVSALETEEAMGQSSYLDFFKTPGNRKRLWVNCMLGFASNWVGNGIITYYLAPVLRSVGITQATTILGINAGYAAWNWLCSGLAGANSERLGRRFLWLACNLGMGFSFCFVMGLSAGFAKTGSAAMGIAVVPFIFIVHLFYDLGYIALNYSYTVEIMPYNLRTKGLALYIFCNNAGNAFNQFANPIALKALAWRYYAVYIAIDLVLGIIIYFQFPETKGMSIEEISMAFDFPVKGAREHVIAHLEEKRASELRGANMADPHEADVKQEASHVEDYDRSKV